ncbi:hypothetical protein V6N13_073261 [Hibiscus sabdariffa]
MNQRERAQATFSSDNTIQSVTIVILILNLDELKKTTQRPTKIAQSLAWKILAMPTEWWNPTNELPSLARKTPPIFVEDVERETTTSTFRETQLGGGGNHCYRGEDDVPWGVNRPKHRRAGKIV